MQNNVGIYASQISGHLWAPSGSMDALASTTVGSTSVATITFSAIPQGYKHLQLRILARGNNANTYDSFSVRFNGDSGNNYTFHGLYGEGVGTPTATGVNPYSAFRGTEITGNNASAGMFGGAIVDVLDYNSTNRYKTARGFGGDDRNGSGIVGITSGTWLNSSAITSIVIAPVFGSLFLQHSQFALYGIK